MKIAYVVPYVPNQIRTRSYNLISSLTELGHEVDVFTVGSSDADRRDAELLNVRCVYYEHQPLWRSLFHSALAVPSNRPLQSVYSWNPKLAAQLKTLLSNYDVLQVEHLRGAAYGTFIKSQFPSMPVVWDSVDCISYLFKQASRHSGSLFGKLMTRFELGRTRNAEGRLLGAFDHVLVTSATDKKALLDIVPPGVKPAPVMVLSNGVDQEYFRLNPEIERDPDTLVFSGKMSYHANVSMVMYLLNEIMPRLWAKRPSVRLVVVGKDPPASIRFGDQALRNDSPKDGGKLQPDLLLLVRWEDRDDSIDRLDRVERMQRAHHQMPGLGRRERRRDRLEVAHLPHQNHIGVLTERGAQGDAK
mgnify:CR=1 FL=1